MNKKILNPVLILGGISLGLGFYGLPKELYPSLLSYAGFLPPYIGAFLTAFGIMNYSGVKWY